MQSTDSWLIIVACLIIGVPVTGCKHRSDSAVAKPRDIYDAAQVGDKSAVEEFLAQGIGVNSRRIPGGQTPLYYAAWKGHKELVVFLVSKGADINARDIVGDTALHMAALSGEKEIAEFLIANGADLNENNGRGKKPWRCTPLHIAVAYGQPAIVELLLSKGADANAKSRLGNTTPLESAILLAETRFRRGSAMAQRKKQFEACVQILREHEAR